MRLKGENSKFWAAFAAFMRLTEQSFDSALELDAQGAVLSKTSGAPGRGWTMGLYSTLSVRDPALECRGERGVWGLGFRLSHQSQCGLNHVTQIGP